jgi:uncharacterized protein
MRNLLFVMIILSVVIISGCAHTSKFDGYLESAKQGDAKSQFKVGSGYWLGSGVPQNYQESFKWFKKSAEQGNSTAQINVAIMYEEGIGVQQDYQSSIKWYKRSMDRSWHEKDYGSAQYRLGNIFFYGRGVNQDYEEAKNWYMKSSDQGFSDAQYRLGFMFYEGLGVKQDYLKSLDFFEKAAKDRSLKTSNSYERLNLGWMMNEGSWVTKITGKKVESGNPGSMFYLGLMYYTGRGVEKNDDEARKWWEKSIKLGHKDSYTYLKSMGNKQSIGVEGYADAESQYNLAQSFRLGNGVPQDFDEAIKWYLMSAEQGLSKSQYALGQMYHVGQGVSQDSSKAFEWYSKSAKQGYADAELSLAYMNYKGEGSSQNYKESIKWFKKLAGRGNAESQYNLGLMYYQGKGTSVNYKESLKLWRKAAEKNNFDALYALGMVYQSGKGVEKNDVLAYLYLNLAVGIEGNSSTNLINAYQLRDIVSETLTPSQVEKAQDLAREWMRTHQ